MSNLGRKILYLSDTYQGSMQDKKICDEDSFGFQKEIELLQDLGYLGHAPKSAKVQMPVKRSKHKKLNRRRKAREQNEIKQMSYRGTCYQRNTKMQNRER